MRGPLPVGKRLAGGLFALAVCVAGVFGCQSGQFPDPNDPAQASPDRLATVLYDDLQRTAEAWNKRVTKGEITDAQRRQILADRAVKLLAVGDPAHSSAKDAWMYADMMITAGRFADAIPLLKTGIDYAAADHDDDRRVNDSLRLARVLAETGKVAESLNLVQAVIDSKPSDPGPVLPSVLLEITPLVEGKGHDLQLAKLLEEAIHEHLLMKVDPNTVAGQMFLLAKQHHIRNAWEKIIGLLRGAGSADEAEAARKRAVAMLDHLRGT